MISLRGNLEMDTPKGRDVWYRSFWTGEPVRFGGLETVERTWLHLDR